MIQHLRRTATARRMSLKAATWFVVAFLGVAGPFDPAPTAAADARPQAIGIAIAGRVLVQGEAAPGAIVYLREAPVAWSSREASMRPVSTRDLGQTTADDTGFFEFKDVRLPETEPRREFIFPLDVIARVPGRGIAWRHVEAPTQSLELNLRDERKVVGRLIDHDGRPAVGIRLSIREIADPGAPWHASLSSPGYLNLDSSEAPLTAVSDANGQCVLRGLPPDIVATVVVDDGRYLRSETFITTAEKPQRELTIWPARADRGQPRVVPVQLWLFKLQLERAYRVHGRVVFADTGQPVAGADVVYQGSGIENGFGMTRPAVRTTSDADGGFVFYDIEPSLDYHVRVADQRRGLGRQIILSQLGEPVAPLTIELKPLAAAVGRVVSEDGRPIAGAVVRLFRTQGRYSSVDAEPVTTDDRGSFELPGLLPGATYSVQTSADGYATRHDGQFTPIAGERFPLGDKMLPRTDQEVSGVLVDADGKPVAGARVFARARVAEAASRARTLTRLTDSEDRFRLSGLPHGFAMVSQSFDQFDNRQSILGEVTAGAMDLRLVAKETAAEAQ